MSGKRAFIFPGQASQFVGMGKDLCEAFAEARQMFEQANDLLGFDIQKICFEGPEEELTKTHITQPAILIHSAIVSTLLQQRGFTAGMAAGHSLGEYSALFQAEVLTFEEVLRLVSLRGQLMHQAGVDHPGTMAAVVGLDPETINAVCAEVSEPDSASGLVVQAANFNSREQTVISGHVEAIEKAMALAKEKGAKIVKRLNVGGAFHSSLMSHAREGLRAGLNAASFKDAKIPIYPNVTAEPEQRAEKLKANLDEQLTSSVRWLDTIENMISHGAEEFWEIGPGKVLSGLLKRIDRRMPARQVGTVADLKSLDA